MRFSTILMLTILFSCCAGSFLRAQNNQWTWVSGNKIVDQSINYGTKGVAAASNYPGSRSGSISFSDNKGNFWLFGGSTIDSAAIGGLRNDLWKWDGTNWTWISGSKFFNQLGNYGTKGIADSANVPGARRDGFGSVDKNGNIWIYAGNVITKYKAVSPINDLWKWDGNKWTWVNGGKSDSSTEVRVLSNYGILGVANASNIPGWRINGMNWTDTIGNFWLFGGYGPDSSGLNSSMNDFWKWDGNNWTWMRGSKHASSKPTYNSTTATPGARSSSAAWTDNSGNFWLFGGYGIDNNFVLGYRNDLWKWDGQTWLWVSGGLNNNYQGIYGVKGVTSDTCYPGARQQSVGWSDSVGNIWIFGGQNILSKYNDLWKWDGKNWTWISGSNSSGQNGLFGTQKLPSITNTPGSRNNGMGWKDSNGKLWLFGGSGKDASTYGSLYLSDKWTWDGKNWTWIDGIDSSGINEINVNGSLGVPAFTNKPAGRSDGVSWKDKNGNFWLFGGDGTQMQNRNSFNDMWKWDGTSWTWVHGSNTLNQLGNYGTKGVAAASNIPGARSGSASWFDNAGNLWLFGGTNYSNDLWKWDGTNWTFIHGNTSGFKYGTQNLTDTSNVPPARTNSVSWKDKNGHLWMFGGLYSITTSGTISYNSMNDLWKWDGTAWTWIKGSNSINQPGVYGTKGIADPANIPRARNNSTCWTDSSNNVWIFGGNSRQGLLNDLWKWDGTNWTWVSGSNIPNPKAVNYGTKGISSVNNVPGERYSSTSWTDNRGNLWLFGGFGVDAGLQTFYLNDLWVWNGNAWTWISGSNTVNQIANYGIKGIGAQTNIPDARLSSFSWNDQVGNLWLFGGYRGGILADLGLTNSFNNYGHFNDLWKFNYGLVTAINNNPAPINQSTILLLNNPSAVNQFTIKSDKFYQKISWQLYDNSARMLQSGIFKNVMKGSVRTTQTNSLIPGIYFLNFIADDKNFQTRKWIKQ